LRKKKQKTFDHQAKLVKPSGPMVKSFFGSFFSKKELLP